MTILPAILIVISAILHSTWNMLLKRNKASLASYILMYLPDLVIWGQLQFWTPVDVWHLPAKFFLMVFLSVCCDLTYGKTLLIAYDRMDMSIAYPMMRSLPILFTMCITTLMRLGEPLKWIAVVGMLLAFTGCLLMPLKSFRELRPGRYLDRNILLVILVALGTTGYTLFDKYAQDCMVAHSPQDISGVMFSVTFYSIRVLTQNACGWTIALLTPSCRRDLLPTLKSHAASVFCAGFCSSLTYILVLVAMHYVKNVSFIQAFRQIGLPIGMFMAILFLHEKCTAIKLCGVTLILLGLVLCLL
jgi:drug/metabolite transporter (DMT)-like permease